MALRKYGRDLTAAAGDADPVIGRDDEIDRVVCILCRRTKNNAVLVGAPGVGKTAIAEGLAQRIAAGTVPPELLEARVVELDLCAIVAGTQYMGTFETRMKEVITEAEDADGKVILFIDEMHMLVGAGECNGSMDAANLLKPALARGRVSCVGATTFDEYRMHIEKDPALERRFQKVLVQEPSVEATIAILRGLRQRYEEHHGLRIRDAAIVAATELAGRYITGRTVDFKNTFIIMTSNLGAEHLNSNKETKEVTRSLLVEKVEKYFRPEFLNRLSEIVVFETLPRDKLKDIVKIQINKVVASVSSKGISLFASDAALDVILSESYKPVSIITVYRSCRQWHSHFLYNPDLFIS
ncbi:hypothetical protein QYE76_058788 [Lolium multiflorum]|uniref:AAA+ ATPase domain-containing protein n=1 Tax=Lolium multiflorum TaxID=4521 RepID=A0AAD8WQ04_LOLMU|nr:hypothetical protein QYE76_058788 [Lolium multiflorum]